MGLDMYTKIDDLEASAVGCAAKQATSGSRQVASEQDWVG
jgi:hypothetical protein